LFTNERYESSASSPDGNPQLTDASDENRRNSMCAREDRGGFSRINLPEGSTFAQCTAAEAGGTIMRRLKAWRLEAWRRRQHRHGV
tara:strand:- start:272 stop:529 length:258 start_codon:yes stop_codon:yes gene_type:complete